MIRILITLGSVALEVVTALSEGALAVSMMIAGIIVTMMHLTFDSYPFQKIVNRLTGFDLPETLEPIPSKSEENSNRLS